MLLRLMETDWKVLEEEWQTKYSKLESDIEIHRIMFILTRKCACKEIECKHYRIEHERLFAARVNQLLANRIAMNASAVGYVINLD